MVLADEQINDVRMQFRQGYDWFVQRTGYIILYPATVNVSALNSKAWPGGNNRTALSLDINNGKPSVELYLGSDNAQIPINNHTFVVEGAQAAFDVYRAHKDMGIHENPVRFVGNLAYREINGKMISVLPFEDGAVYTTSDFVQRISGYSRSGMSSTLRPQVRSLVADELAKIAPNYSVTELEQITEQTVARMVDDMICTPRVAQKILEKMWETDMYKTVAPYLEANDIVDDFSSGREDPNLVRPFLRFLSDELYDPQEKIRGLFSRFKASHAQRLAG